MKPNYLFTGILAATAMVVVSCSTPKLANQTAMQDDVYHSVAQAREYRAVEPIQITTDSADYYGSAEPNYDMDYSSRINRFYYASPWRTYYDDYYGYNPYGFNSYYGSGNWGLGFGFGFGFNYGFNNWYNPYSNWAYYGSPYYYNYWGPYSYYNPYYGGGFIGGGHWGGGFIGNIVSRPNNPRPSRGSENNIYRGNGANGNPSSARPIGSTAGRSRAEMYNPSTDRNNGTSNARPNSSSNARPTRGDNGSSARPTRTSEAPPSRPTYTPPPASSNGGGGRSSGSGSSSSGAGRPTRGGGR